MSKPILNNLAKELLKEPVYISLWNFSQQLKEETEAIDTKVGDICLFDYGLAYQYEAGFQHLGLILSISKSKLFVVPMTSNQLTYQKSKVSENLFALPKFGNQKKDSALFLNDAKYVSSRRAIKVIDHIDKGCVIFRQIKKEVINLIEKGSEENS